MARLRRFAGILGSTFLALACVLAATATAEEAKAARRPNIVLVMSDDMGFSDLGCYGGEHATPNLDALASKGVRFTQFYNTARCCPTRASLLSGLYPHQAGIGHMMDDRGHDGYRGVLNRNAVTIAEALQPAGYRTYMAGKWHVTRFIGPDADRGTWPLGRGFEKFYGTITGAGSYYDPSTLVRQDKLITPDNDPEYKPESYYYTDAITDNAVRFLQQHQTESPDKPFFMYVAYTAAHWPMHAPDAAVAKYKGQFDGGYAPLRAARLDRMKQSGLLPADAELSPGAEDWDAVPDKAWEARCKEVYAAMIEIMDQGIGRIVDQLKTSNQLDDTLILFLEDNGGCAENTGPTAHGSPGPRRPEAVGPRRPPDSGDTDPDPRRPSGPPGPRRHARPGGHVHRLRPRLGQRQQHAVPRIQTLGPRGRHLHPPDRPLARRDQGRTRGAFERQPGHLIDIMATCVDLAGATYPIEKDGKTIKPLEGVSLRPAFNGEPLARTQPSSGSTKATAPSARANGSSWPRRTSPGSFTTSPTTAPSCTTWRRRSPTASRT